MAGQAALSPDFADPRAAARPMAGRPAVSRLLLVCLGALALSWAAIVNGGPFYHPDTVSYIRGPDVAVLKVLGPRFTTPWARHEVRVGQSTGSVRAGASYNDHEVLAGRSVYYGVLAWLGDKAGGFWLTVAVQALAVAYLLDALLRALGLRGPGAYAAAAGLVAAGTPAPLFVALLMPDIWAGVGLGAAVLLLSLGQRVRPVERATLTALLAFSALAHTSNLLLLVAVLVLGAGLRWLAPSRIPPVRVGLVAGAVAVLVALAGGFAFTFAVTHLAGASPISPPFITARLVADGTGARYLARHCPAVGFEACRYRNQRPVDADDYLWSLEPAKAVFATATPASRRALAGEQLRLGLAVAADDPAGQIAASTRNVLAQLGDSDLMNFNYKASVRSSLDVAVPPSRLSVFANTLAYHELWPLAAMQAWYAAVRIAGVVALVGWLAWRWRSGGGGRERSLRAVGVLLVGGVLANAAICGALSSPYGRYQARLDWLLPLAALALVMSLCTRPGGDEAV